MPSTLGPYFPSAPRPWLWHALFDGTRLCCCARSAYHHKRRRQLATRALW